VHRKLVPGGQSARAGVRCGRAGPGRGDRGAAHGRRRQEPLRHARRPLPPRQFDEVSDRADAPIEEALAMLVRERLTGMVPRRRERVVELWRPLLEERAGRNLDRSKSSSRTRRASATSCTICSTTSTWARTAAPMRTTKRARGRSGQAQGPVRRGRRGRAVRRRAGACRRIQSRARNVDTTAGGRRALSAEMSDDRRHGRFGGAGGAAPAAPGTARTSRAVRKSALRGQVRRGRGGRRAVRRRELDRLRGYLDKQLRTFRACWARLANRCSVA